MGMCPISKHANYSQILASKRYTCVYLSLPFICFLCMCVRVCVYALTPNLTSNTSAQAAIILI